MVLPTSGRLATMPATAETLQPHRLLFEAAAKELLAAHGIPVVPTTLARSPAEAVRLAKQCGLPVVLKVASPDIVHKSDVGGVRLKVTSLSQVHKAYGEILTCVRAQRPQARLDGVTVQTMAKPGLEVVAGVIRDRTFGPIVMFGLGGMFVELLDDVAFRVVPLRPRDARAMIQEIRGAPLLQGYRGTPPVALHALEDMLLKLSTLAERRSDVSEVDVNTIRAYPEGALAVDARILLA